MLLMMFMLILAPVLSTVMDINIMLYPSVHFPHQFISERNHVGLSVFQKELALTGCCFTRAHFLFMVLGVSVVIFALMVTSRCGYVYWVWYWVAQVRWSECEVWSDALARGECGSQSAAQSLINHHIHFKRKVDRDNHGLCLCKLHVNQSQSLSQSFLQQKSNLMWWQKSNLTQ